MGDRREELAHAATDYVLAHGLIGLSLRPLAAEIGTSDRMLLYHFRDKADLLATVLRVSNDRSVHGIRDLAPSPGLRAAVLDLWAVLSTPEQARCLRLYVEAAALGVLGAEPYASVVAAANEVWLQALADHLSGSGLALPDARRAARLVEATFMGLQLDEPLEDPDDVRRSVTDLADAVAVLWAPRGGEAGRVEPRE
ncbi:MAG: TetR/AcrR family transcriptional regulator [Marmoricola sp.]|nr:TetR/AcrR family transcriptional regulator [Marmoricola sp.]